MKEKIFNFIKKIIFSYAFKVILLSLIINIFCDILNQRSLIEPFVRMFTKPLNFIFNMVIISTTISLSGLFKKRKFALIMLSLPWVGMSITNFVVQCFRNTPVSFIDFLLLPSVFSAFNSYLNLFHYILIGVGVALVIFGLVLLYKKEIKKDRVIKPSVITVVVLILLAILFKAPLVKVGALSDDYSNLTNAYREYGLPYCFVVSCIDRGVDEPEVYSEEEVIEHVNEIEKLLGSLNYQVPSNVTINSDKKPNVIFLQLESFMDANNYKHLNYSSDPNPFFTYLKENYPSGHLTVPSYGAGTANVEFEVMTGLNLNNFGAGEYPYKTVLVDNTTESIAYTLNNQGYFSTIIHNNRASFYDRDQVFPNLGYNRFVSSEYMINLEYTPVGWFKDNVLTYEIMKALKNTSETDFIYTISVQPHGKYLSDLSELENIYVQVESANIEMTEEEMNQYTYYINQIYEVDLFLKELVEAINNYDEPVMLVTYGDHLPNFEIEDEYLTTGSRYNSEYVIYTNYDLELEDKDLYTYQLSSYVMQNIGCNEGIINQLHQTKNINELYEESSLVLTYDIFSKSKYLWNGTCPYKTTQMQLGYDDIVITEVINNGSSLTIKGENFTLNSIVYFGNKKQETKYINTTTLMVDIDNIKKPQKVTVKQVYKYEVYSSTNVVLVDIDSTHD